MFWEIHDGEAFSADGIAYEVASATECTVSMTGYVGSVGAIPASVYYKGWNLSTSFVEEGAFYGCTMLSSADLSNVKSIGAGAFSGCSNLTEVRFGDFLESIDGDAFSDLLFLDADGEPVSSVQDLRGNSFHKSGGALCMFWDIVVGEVFTVGGIDYKVTSVNEMSVSITGHSGDVEYVPATVSYNGWDLAVRSVGKKAFYDCSTLTYADLSNVRTIGTKAFAGCTRLSGIEFGPSLESVGDYAFHGLSFYDGGEKMEVSAAALKGGSFSGSGGKLYLES
jgi:hypothetical protein